MNAFYSPLLNIVICHVHFLLKQVVFKDKVVPLSSNYRDDPNLNKADIFVVDIYQLASHLFSEAEVKTMKIGDIIAKVLIFIHLMEKRFNYIRIQFNCCVLVSVSFRFE